MYIHQTKDDIGCGRWGTLKTVQNKHRVNSQLLSLSEDTLAQIHINPSINIKCTDSKTRFNFLSIIVNIEINLHFNDTQKATFISLLIGPGLLVSITIHFTTKCRYSLLCLVGGEIRAIPDCSLPAELVSVKNEKERIIDIKEENWVGSSF